MGKYLKIIFHIFRVSLINSLSSFASWHEFPTSSAACGGSNGQHILDCLDNAIKDAHATLSNVLAKARFWERVAGIEINERQRLILDRLLDGFEGKLTLSKYAKLAKCSNGTALRDILCIGDVSDAVRHAHHEQHRCIQPHRDAWISGTQH